MTEPLIYTPIHTTKTQWAFTMVELMAVIAVIGILSAFAFPSYQAHVKRANRAEAKSILLEASQLLEKNFTVNNCYHRTDASCASTGTTGTGAWIVPFTCSPKSAMNTNRTCDASKAKYTISVAFSTTSPCTLGLCFTLSAAPTGTMTGDSCGTLTLNQAGAQGAGGTLAECWQR